VRRVAGYPTSPNRASSLHLLWELPAGTGPLVAASVALVVEAAPGVPNLYFWRSRPRLSTVPAGTMAAVTSGCSGTGNIRAHGR
jgi:hypothetical protein